MGLPPNPSFHSNCRHGHERTQHLLDSHPRSALAAVERQNEIKSINHPINNLGKNASRVITWTEMCSFVGRGVTSKDFYLILCSFREVFMGKLQTLWDEFFICSKFSNLQSDIPDIFTFIETLKIDFHHHLRVRENLPKILLHSAWLGLFQLPLSSLQLHSRATKATLTHMEKSIWNPTTFDNSRSFIKHISSLFDEFSKHWKKEKSS